MTTKTNIEAVNSGQTEREAFEAWAKGRFNLKPLAGEGAFFYEKEPTQDAWDAWQARAAASQAEPSTGICFFCGEPIDGKHESDCPQREHCEFSAEGIKQIWKRVNGTHPDNGVFGRMVVDFGRALLADQSPAPASPSGEDAAEEAAAPVAEPIYQAMATDDDPNNSAVWMDVDLRAFESLKKRSDVRCRIVYAAPLPRASEQADEAVTELQNIVNAKRFDRDTFANDTEFADWVQSRARHTLGRAKEPK